MSHDFAPIRVNAEVRVRREDGSISDAVPIRPRSHFSIRIERDSGTVVILPDKRPPTTKEIYG